MEGYGNRCQFIFVYTYDLDVNKMNEEKNSYEDEGYFKFPFKPYSIQEDFMKKLYYTLDNDKIGIFESPTGTVSKIMLCFLL